MKLNPNITKALVSARRLVADKAPEILTGMAVGGYLTAIGLSIKATIDAVHTYDELGIDKLTKENASMVVAKVARPYIPALVVAAVSTACCIGARNVSARRYAALNAAFTIAETTLADYQKTLPQVVGEKKAARVEEAVTTSLATPAMSGFREDVAENTGHGTTLCYDATLGGYFYSSSERIRQAVNDVNESILSSFGMTASVNDFYHSLGRKLVEYGDDLGWNVDHLLNVKFSSDLVSRNGEMAPLLIIRYEVSPTYRDL